MPLPLQAVPRQGAVRGFTLVELLVTITLLAILLSVALPSLSAWVRSAKTRTVAESLVNGLRSAQAAAVQTNRQVVFSLTNEQPAKTSTAVANGRNWVVRTVPLPGEDAEFVSGGSLGATADGVAITGVASICFNSLGRPVANAAPGTTLKASGGVTVSAGTCALPDVASPTTYNIAQASPKDDDRTLRVTVNLGGQVRMCDPARTLAASPDGCA